MALSFNSLITNMIRKSSLTYLVFNVLALLFVGSVINGLVYWFAYTFWVVMADLVGNSVGYWVAYFFRDSVAF